MGYMEAFVNATVKQRHTAIMLARLAVIVVMLLFMHDAMMAMSPHTADHESHHELTIAGQECGNTEGITRSIPDSPFGPILVTITPIDLGLAFDVRSSIRIEPVRDGPDSSTIRVWQQVFLN